MNFIILAIAGYFLIALEAVLSKFLLTGKIKSWRLYVFYVGILALFSVVFAPLGLAWYGQAVFIVSLLSGAVLFIYLMLLYQALEKYPASFVYVLSGAVSTIVVLLLSLLTGIESLGLWRTIGIMLLVGGGTMISLDTKNIRLAPGTLAVVLSGVLMGVSLVLLKYAYVNQNFASGYIYTRMGEVLAALIALAIPSFRHEVFALLKQKGAKENASHFSATTIAKILAGIGTLLINVAIFNGSVTIVNALVSVQYLFTFILSIILTMYFAQIFRESLQKRDLIIKGMGVVIVIGGIILVQ